MIKKMNDLTELTQTFVSSKTKLFAALTIFIFMIVGWCVSWGETTGIDSIIYGDDGFGDNASGSGRFTHGIYTLQGQFIGNDSSQLAGFPSGIYLVNGKKVAVK